MTPDDVNKLFLTTSIYQTLQRILRFSRNEYDIKYTTDIVNGKEIERDE